VSGLGSQVSAGATHREEQSEQSLEMQVLGKVRSLRRWFRPNLPPRKSQWKGHTQIRPYHFRSETSRPHRPEFPPHRFPRRHQSFERPERELYLSHKPRCREEISVSSPNFLIIKRVTDLFPRIWNKKVEFAGDVGAMPGIIVLCTASAISG